MTQLSYSTAMRSGTAGLIADAFGTRNVRTYNNPVDVIQFGRGVAKVSGTDSAVELPDGAEADLIGVAVLSREVEGNSYEAQSALGILNDGTVWVDVEEAVAPDDDVYVRHSGRAQGQDFTLDADIVVDNTVAVTVDGVPLTQDFDTDHLTSIQALAAQILDQPGVADVVVGGADNRTITVRAQVQGVDVVLTDEGVTGGASQANITITEITAGVSPEDRGMFRADSDTNTAVQFVGARWLSSAEAGSVAQLAIKVV